MFLIGEENLQAALWMLLCGAVLALGVGVMRCAKAGVRCKRTLLCTALLPLCAAFVSHLGYWLCNLPLVLYSYPLGYAAAFWQRGHMMYAALFGALLALVIGGGSERAKVMQAYAPSMALIVLFARLAEGCMGQGYGEYWYGEEGILTRIPFMTYDPYYECWGWALFMAGAAIALILFIVLMTQKPAFDGDGMLLFFGLYAAAQVVLESLRRDEFLRWGFVRVEELLSAVVLLTVLILYWVRTGKARAVCKASLMALFVAMVVFCLLLEFATEGRIPFLVFLDVWHCYALMAVACMVNAACVVCMRRMSVHPKENC